MYKDIKIKYSEEFARYTDAVLVTGDVNAYRIVLETPWELDGCNFKVTAKRADGKVVTDLGTTEGTKAICVLASGVYSVVGDLTMQLTLESVDGTVLTACEITATVAEGNGEGEQAENLTPVLDKAIERITVLEAEMRASASNLANGDGIGSVMLKTAAGAISEGAVAFGKNSIAGSKCFNITAFDDVNKAYTLDSVEGLAVGDVFSLKLNNNYDSKGKITAISGKVVAVDNYQPDETSDVKYFRVPLKPTCGTTDFGLNAYAEGENCIAAGDNSHASGKGTYAKGRYAHTEGKSTEANYASHAEGAYTEATGEYSHAEGMYSGAKGQYSHAEGYATQANGKYSHSEGLDTTAGDHSHVEGVRCAASYLSHVEGSDSKALGSICHVEGEGCVAASDHQHVQGKWNIEDRENKYAHIVGNGAAEWRSNAYTLDWEGNASFAGDVTIFMKNGSKKMSMSQIPGYKTPEGGETFNDGNTANAEYSHAEGQLTTASGAFAHSEGYRTRATGVSSHAEGMSCEATYNCAHAEGRNTTSSGLASHVEGWGSKATAEGSHAENYSIANGRYSHSEGYGTSADSENQHVQGKYNIKDIANKYIHIAGNGTSDAARSNAYTLDWNGNGWFAGNVETTSVILRATNGNRYEVVVDNNGNLKTTKIA